MAYEHTLVSPEKSQAAIKKLLVAHGSVNVSFASSSKPMRQEGFRASVVLDGKPYGMKIVVPVQEMANNKAQDQVIRRVWRVLYHHMKAIFEAADSGVIDIRELLLPFLVTKNGQTVGQIVLQDMEKIIEKPKQVLLG